MLIVEKSGVGDFNMHNSLCGNKHTDNDGNGVEKLFEERSV